MVRRFREHIRRYPKLIANGLLIQKVLLTLRSAGIVIEPYYFYQESPSGPLQADTADRMEGFEFRELGREDTAEIASFYRRHPSAEEIRRRFEGGQRCFALKSRERIAAFSWCDTAEISFRPCGRPLEGHEAYLYGAETLFEFRGRKLQPFLRRRCYEALNAEGKWIFYSYSDFFNYPALHFKAKVGARVLRIGLSLRIFNILEKGWTLKQVAEVADPRQGGEKSC